ncbi:macrophage mannose receptor 1-like [Aricia agestis]|uniref:macrophage mannose receptor 1-like n=1 Tax=Aricia agestis TaxID=91739 RepID=UPI001C206CDB|nr:macrophage mannose receptor 1-like [Aricia agestis]
MFTKCLLLVLLYSFSITNGKPDKFFRKGYKYLEETKSFYKFHTVHKKWEDAKSICEMEGATLFYPQDEEEANAVISYWNATQTFLWIYIGISTPTVKEIFETVDGLPIEDVYDNWAPGEPNNAGGVEECVVLRREGVLNDDRCDKAWPYICKKTEASLRWNDLCDIPDPEYTYYEKTGRCYKLHLTPKNWKDAYTTCSYEQSRLAVIDSDEEANILVNMINSSPKDLIDGDYLRGAVHLGFKYLNGWKTYRGTDLRSNGYAKWGKGQPDGRGNETCGSMFYNDGKSDKFFRKDYQYLEETRSFYKFQTIRKSWRDAKSTCELEGATLFYPQDEEEAKAVISYWNATQNYRWIYIGISAPIVNEVFETVDGLPIEDVYGKWGPGQPKGGSHKCVILRREGFLADAECELPWVYMCKKTEASLRWNDLCNIPDPEYTYYQKTGRCYKLHLTPKNWADSYITCSMEQSRLAVINSDEEANILVDIIKNSPKDLIDGDYLRDAVYLGFKFDDGWKTYVGTDLRSSGYVKWGPGLPEDRGNRTCGGMFYDGLLNAVSCDDKAFFICEHEIRLLQTALDYKFGEENAVQHGYVRSEVVFAIMIKWFLLLACVYIIDCRPEKFFRKGYKYLEETKSFYKIQTVRKKWQEAKTTCELEGATLYYPRDEDEDSAVMAYWNATQTFQWIYIGISTPHALEIFETVDGLGIDDVYDNWAPGEPNRAVGDEECVTLKNVQAKGRLIYDSCLKNLPYICKKTEASLRWNDQCDIPDPEYIFSEKTGRCYKLHLTPKTWANAYITCVTEQSRLAVINSDVEASVLVDIIKNSFTDLIDGNYLRGTAYLGFKYDDGWKTYLGTDLRSSGYVKWGKDLPEGRGDRTCGGMFFDGLLNAVSCDAKAFFICEHEIRLLQTALDYKFGDN